MKKLLVFLLVFAAGSAIADNSGVSQSDNETVEEVVEVGLAETAIAGFKAEAATLAIVIPSSIALAALLNKIENASVIAPIGALVPVAVSVYFYNTFAPDMKKAGLFSRALAFAGGICAARYVVGLVMSAVSMGFMMYAMRQEHIRN